MLKNLTDLKKIFLRIMIQKSLESIKKCLELIIETLD